MKLRLEGRVLAKWTWGGQTLYRGQLEIAERRDTHLRRFSTQAWMRHSPHQDVDELGTLFDVRILWMDSEFMSLTGFEREPLMKREYAQTWLVRPITAIEATTSVAPRARSTAPPAVIDAEAAGAASRGNPSPL